MKLAVDKFGRDYQRKESKQNFYFYDFAYIQINTVSV